MMEIFTANSLEEAKQQAADAFHVASSAITFTILEEPKRGFLGLKKTGEYKVRAEYDAAAENEADATVSGDTTASSSADTMVADVTFAEAEQVSDPVVSLEKMQAGLAYLDKILDKLAPGVKAEAQLTDSGVEIELSGEAAGALIGRRGETLDAMQYLVSMVGNRGDRDYLRMTLDTCGYREKRKNALQELAVRISKSVLRNGRSVALEPMNPYERRIIHSAVTAIEGVSSHSAGEEPNRKVIISSDHPVAARPERSDRPTDRRRDARGDTRGDRYSRSRSPRPEHSGTKAAHGGPRPSTEGPRKLDLSTSFEKDYKRPKPEDSLHTGVYGKIDLD